MFVTFINTALWLICLMHYWVMPIIFVYAPTLLPFWLVGLVSAVVLTAIYTLKVYLASVFKGSQLALCSKFTSALNNFTFSDAQDLAFKLHYVFIGITGIMTIVKTPDVSKTLVFFLLLIASVVGTILYALHSTIMDKRNEILHMVVLKNAKKEEKEDKQ